MANKIKYVWKNKRFFKLNLVVVDGGFGNQLFQIAFALYLTENFKNSVAIDLEIDPIRHRHGVVGVTEIACALNLGICKEFRSKEHKRFALLRRSMSTRKLFQPLNKINCGVTWGGDRIYAGYWQNFEQLEPFYIRVADACREVLNLKPSGESCVHVRFGDYTSPKNRVIYSEVASSYYASGLECLKNETESSCVRVLSDDTDSARLMFSSREFGGRSFRYDRGDMISDFSALSQSREIIASNSTFCWWGALVSARLASLENLGSPKNWFNPGFRHRQAPSYMRLSDLGNRKFTNVLV